MSNSDHENTAIPMSDSDSSRETQPIPMSDSETSQENQPPIPMSDSSSDVHRPPTKRARTLYDMIQQKVGVTGTTQENPTHAAGPSETKQLPFHLTCGFKHARQLKFAIQALCDPVFNNLEFGRIDADVNGLNVTVQNSVNNVVGHLCLKPSDFSCTKPIESKIVNLNELYKKLAGIEEDDNAFAIIQDEGSDDLTFFALGFEKSVTLLENNAEIPKFPETSLFCKAVVPYDHFNEMLKHLLQQATHEVLVEITENSAMLMLMVKIENSWKAEYPMLKVAGRRVVEPGRNYCASFQWTNAEWLSKTSDMETTCEVRLHAEPLTYIVLSFVIKDVGCLEYVKIPVP